MTCPDLASLGRAGTTRADPTVVEHLHRCQSCWLDWQIQQAARYLVEDDTADPAISQCRDRRVMALIRARAEGLDRPARWIELGLSAVLIAFAAVVFLVMRGHAVSMTGAVVGYLVGGSIIGASYCWARDRTLVDRHRPKQEH